VQGVEIQYLGAAMSALADARVSLLAQPPSAVAIPGSGKEDTKLFDSVAEQAIATRLQEFNSRCAVITEEKGVIGEKMRGSILSYIVDPFDRSRPFVRAVGTALASLDPTKCKTIGDVIGSVGFTMAHLEAPFASITCIRDGDIIFNVMVNYTDGSLYVACQKFVGSGSIHDTPTPADLFEKGKRLRFVPRSGQRLICFTGDPDKDKEPPVNEHSSKYMQILHNLGFSGFDRVKLSNPGGPARILYLTDLYTGEDPPSLILSNGEKVFEFLGWLAFAIYSRDLAVFELYSEGFEARGNILQAPPPNYSAFVKDVESKKVILNIDRILDLDPPGHYRSALVVTNVHSTVACATMRAKKKSREIYFPSE